MSNGHPFAAVLGVCVCEHQLPIWLPCSSCVCTPLQPTALFRSCCEVGGCGSQKNITLRGLERFVASIADCGGCQLDLTLQYTVLHAPGDQP